MISVPKRDAAKKLKKATEQDRLNHKEKACELNMESIGETNDRNIQRKRSAVEKLNEAMNRDELNKKREAYKLYMEALEDAGVYLFFEKDPVIKKENLQIFVSHYERATEIRDEQYPQESYLSHKAEVGLGLAESSLNLKLSDVGGLDACKKLLEEAAILPIDFPHFFTGKLILHHCGFVKLCFMLVYFDILIG